MQGGLARAMLWSICPTRRWTRGLLVECSAQRAVRSPSWSNSLTRTPRKNASHSSRVVVTTPPTRSKPSGVWLTSMYGLGAPVLRAWVRVAKAAGVVWSTAPLGSLLSVSLMPEASAATFYASPSPQYEDFCDAGVVMVGPFTVGGQSCG